jgi:hypothetical protein
MLKWLTTLLFFSVTASAAQPTGKPWLDDTAAYLSDRTCCNIFIGRSGPVCLTPSEAYDRACRDAAGQIVEHLRPRLSTRIMRADTSRLIENIRGDLIHGKYVTDRYAQQQSKPYGEIWSQAILINLEKRDIERLTAQCEHILRQREQTLLGAAGAIVVMAGVVFLIYVTLNWLTKGYARGRLRALATLSMLGGTGIVFWVVHRLI